jgi:hypothetical protein
MLAHHTTDLESSLPQLESDAILRTPIAVEGKGGASSAKVKASKNKPVMLRDQMVDLLEDNGMKSSVQKLFPTPDTMGHLPPRTPEQLIEAKKRSPAGYSNLRETVVNDLLPTPTAVHGNTVAKSELDANDPKHRLKVRAQVLARDGFSWGKFEPAIKRWENVLGVEAPPPTKPDGKDGAHRLSSEFTEWMMGLPKGWVTNVGVGRTAELRACGNGVVPQQALLALSMLITKEEVDTMFTEEENG